MKCDIVPILIRPFPQRCSLTSFIYSVVKEAKLVDLSIAADMFPLQKKLLHSTRKHNKCVRSALVFAGLAWPVRNCRASDRTRHYGQVSRSRFRESYHCGRDDNPLRREREEKERERERER